MSNLSVATWRAWKNADTEPVDAVVQAAIDAGELAINNDLKRKMVVASASSTRPYVPGTSPVLRIHDCTTITSVTNDGTAIASGTGGYQAEPVTVSWSGEVFPYDQIRLLGGIWVRDYGRATVLVTATWGWAALPAAYTEATKILVADLLEQKDLRNGVVGFTEFATVLVRANPVVRGLLKPYRRIEAVAGPL